MSQCAVFIILTIISVFVPSTVMAWWSVGTFHGDCMCARTTVNARSYGSLSARVKFQLQPGHCGRWTGDTDYADDYEWYKIIHNGQTVWVASDYLQAEDSSYCEAPSSCPRILSRSIWNARSPRDFTTIYQPISYVIIHHTAGRTCSSMTSCASIVRGIQNDHMDSRGWWDIGCNFLVGGDGSVFEGRGWDKVGSHTRGHNSQSLGVCLLGNFVHQSPSRAQLSSTQSLIQCGVSLGKVSSSYTLRGHNHYGNTLCPGNNLISEIQTWSHYSN